MAETLATHGGLPASPSGRVGGALQGDARLAALAAGGDERAFEWLVRRYDASLRGYGVQLLGSVEDAEDALQDALASAHRALIERGPPDEPRAWLFTIVRNRCLGLLRSRRPQPATLDDPRLPAAAGAAETALTRADLRALVRDLERLDADAREALVLTRLGDFSHREAAAIIGCAPERVRTLVRQARIELAAGMAAREQPCSEIQIELAELRRGGFRRAHIRKHLAACEVCSSFRVRLAERERGLAILLPVPAAALEALGRGGEAGAAAAISAGSVSTAGSGSLLALGGAKLAATLAAGAAILGGGGALVAGTSGDPALGARSAEPVPATTSPAPDERAVQPSSARQPASQAKAPQQSPPPPVDPVATTAPEPDDNPSRATAIERPAPEPDSSGPRGSQTGEIPSPTGTETEDAPPPEPDTDGPRPEPEPEDPDAGGDGGLADPGPPGS